MRIQLKNLKFAAFASEETYCFEASLWIDGNKVGDVSNDGRGGPHRIFPWGLEGQIDAYAKTLPKVEIYGRQIDQSAEMLISDLVTKELLRRDLKKALKSRILYIKDGAVFESRKYTEADIRRFLADPKTPEKLGANGPILNLLDEAAALALYTKH